MPRYDYRCNDCGVVYEKREGFDAPALQTCPECSGSARRVLTTPAIVFKGSGWYSTDSRKGSSNGESPSSSSDASSAKGDAPAPSKDTAGSSSGKDSAGSSSGKDSATTSKSESTAKT